MPPRRTLQRTGVAQREPVALDKLQYKFNACPKEGLVGCPDEELFDCWRYEFAREVDWLTEFVAKQLEEPEQARDFFSFPLFLQWPFLLFPQWPEKPYLSVDPIERHRLLQSVRST